MKEWMKDMLQRIKEDLAKAYKSWTVLFNAALAAINGIWLYLLANPDVMTQVQASLPQLEGMLSPKSITMLAGAINIINIILRFKTSGRIADK